MGLYTLSWGKQTDVQTYIGKNTANNLLELRDRIANRPTSLRELLLLLLDANGQTFNQLWAQLNILRRTTRVQLASVLSLFPCFTHGEGKRWHVIDEAIDEGYRKELLPYVLTSFGAAESGAGSIGAKE